MGSEILGRAQVRCPVVECDFYVDVNVSLHTTGLNKGDIIASITLDEKGPLKTLEEHVKTHIPIVEHPDGSWHDKKKG